MKTIRGKIICFFVLCLVIAGMLTALNYQYAFSLKRKLYTIERFDDLLNDVLELRRYEKNFIFYDDTSSLKEGKIYLQKIDDNFKALTEDIKGIVGNDEYQRFSQDMRSYKQTLDDIIIAKEDANDRLQVDLIREKGKSLVDFAQRLIWKKRERIEETLKRALTITVACMGSLVIFAIAISHFVNSGILKPLSLVEEATEKVAKESFTPIFYDKEKQDEITRLIASFNKMAGELESRQEQLVQSRKLAAIGTFTSGIAHELNNPLNNISITAEVMKSGFREISEKEMAEMIDDTLNQADRASQVVKNLLEFSRTERPYSINLNIREVVDNTVNLIRNQLMVAKIQLEIDVAIDLPCIRGRRQDIQQIFLNILLNSIHAMPKGGCMHIRADHGPEGYIRIDLTDTGTGIKPEALEHIFEPFFTTKESGQGTGLGLSMVYGIIRSHGGYIEVKSELDKGTTFSIYFPSNSGKKGGEDEIQSCDC